MLEVTTQAERGRAKTLPSRVRECIVRHEQRAAICPRNPGPFRGVRWHGECGARGIQMTIRILLADDHAVVRRGLRMVLSLEADFEVVGEAADGAEALRLARELRPNVVLMDLRMPVMDGIASTRAIRSELPGTQVVALTSVLEDGAVVEAVRAGAISYILKTADAPELCEAIRKAAAGQGQLSPQAAMGLMREIRTPEAHEGMSAREVDVLRLLAMGKANKEIAVALAISERTVKTHVSNIMAKLGVQSRTQAALYAVKAGLLAGPSS